MMATLPSVETDDSSLLAYDFNPRTNTTRRSILRLINPYDFSIRVSIAATSDGIPSPRDQGPTAELGPRQSANITATELETGVSDLVRGQQPARGRREHGGGTQGKFRLQLSGSGELNEGSYTAVGFLAMSIMETGDGRLYNNSFFQLRHFDFPDAEELENPEGPDILPAEDFNIELVFRSDVTSPARDKFVKAARPRGNGRR